MNARSIFLALCSAACLTGAYGASTEPELAEADILLDGVGANHQRIAYVAPASSESRSLTNEFVQIELGLNYLGPNGEWLPSRARFEETTGWAVAKELQHYVALYHNLNVEGAVVLDQADGRRLRSQIQGLAYFDPDTGESVLLAEVKDSQGFFVGEDQVIYPDAFEHPVDADVRYTVGKWGLEQDVIIRSQLPAPENFGLSSATARLEVWTEFIEGGDPEREVHVVNGAAVDEGAAPIVDETLNFGSMRIGLGRAFILGQEDDSLALVAKSWAVTPEGRRYLVEAVEASVLVSNELPAAPEGAFIRKRYPARLQALREFPTKSKPQDQAASWNPWNRETLIANYQRPGVVVDYSIINYTTNNMTFRGDETYYVSGLVTCNGTTTFEGGAVIKFANTNQTNLRIDIGGTTVWPTDNYYRPIIFTGKDDVTVGETLPGASGTLSGYYADTALKWGNATTAIDARNLRFAHAKNAIALNAGSSQKFRHVQFVNCESGMRPTSTDFGLHNALFTGVTYIFNGSSATGRVEHATVNGATALNYNSTFGSGNLRLTNSLIVEVTTLGSLTATNKVAFLSSATGVFATQVAGGAHYLATGSPQRDLGTIVSTQLSGDLPKMTTYAPTRVTGTISTSTQFAPANSRDTNTLDLGYHYWPIDFVFSGDPGVIVTNATVSLKDGVVISHDDIAALFLTGTSSFSSVGLPTRENIITYYTTVQEKKSATHDSGAKYPVYSLGNYNVGTRSIATRFTTYEGATVPYYYALYSVATLITQSIELRDSQFYYADVDVQADSGGPFVMNWINNLWFRPAITTFGNYSHFLANQTVDGGYVSMFTDGVDWRDSLLRSCGITITDLGSGATNRNNLFVSLTSFSSSGSNVSCITNSPFNFASDTLGPWYQSSTTGINMGSRTPGAAGLAHYTVKTDQSKDTGSQVDIGYHYIALNGSDLPVDTDGDGIPDNVEDTNGNGSLDSGESNLNSATDLGFRVRITDPKTNAKLP